MPFTLLGAGAIRRHPKKIVPVLIADARGERPFAGLADRPCAAHEATMPTVGYAPPLKRSILVAGHPTSVSLEPLFWHALEVSAADMGRPVNALVAEIDAARLEVDSPPNLTSAIRQWLFARALSG